MAGEGQSGRFALILAAAQNAKVARAPVPAPLSAGAKPGPDRIEAQQALNKRLLGASAEGDLESVRQALAQGADVNARDENNGTPLMWAASRRHTEIAGLLIASGADVNARDKGEGTALMDASRAGATEIVEMLLPKVADLNAEDCYHRTHRTALKLAIENHRAPVVKLLRSHGATE